MIERNHAGLSFQLEALYRFEGDAGWTVMPMTGSDPAGYHGAGEGIHLALSLGGTTDGACPYAFSFEADRPAQARLALTLSGERFYHLLPGNIYGDNNIAKARTGEYIMLTDTHPEDVFCSPFWELRADRAPQPVVMVMNGTGVAAMSVNPYTDLADGGFVRNGLRCELPATIAVSAGYTNDPVTYTNKRTWNPSTAQFARTGRVEGYVYAIPGGKTDAVPLILRREYARTREVPTYRRTAREAAQALLDAFLDVSWNEDWHNYTNCECNPPAQPELKAWRQLPEIGWTGGGILSYPFLLAEDVLSLPAGRFDGKMDGRAIADEIASVYNPLSGFINDVTRPDWKPDWAPNPVNGWWAYLGLTEDCHCAYTNGSAVYYLLKMVLHQQARGIEEPLWRDTALKVLETVMSLQGESGSYGYTYSRYERKVLDWDGFAGCWFAAAMPLAYQVTGDRRYLESCGRALRFYGAFVRDLNCYGTPMDTWKSVDQEGNLAYIRAARMMHELTGEDCWLDALRDGAHYQFLWQFGFKARPELPPLKGHWNSCGGSYTSVSNPHVHPMGVLVIDDLEYLSRQTGDPYYHQRAEDQFAWAMHTLELYPEVSGYGRYGLLTERYCPSDGLTVEEYSDGSHSSMWFSYNGWAGANMLEAMLEAVRRQEQG